MRNYTTAISVLLVIYFTLQTGYCFLPVRVGSLSSTHNDYSISGSVFLLDRGTIYIKNFTFDWDNLVPGLTLSLGGNIIRMNNSIIPINQVGDGVVSSLKCHTDDTTCCRSVDNPNGGGQGEWYFPDGRVVPNPPDSQNGNFYRTRGAGEARLNRRRGNSPAGKYCCKLPTASGEIETICADLVLDVPSSHGDAHFCAGFSPNSSSPVVIPLDQSTVGFISTFAQSHLELRLPSGYNISQLAWFGVCSSMSVLAKVTIHPSSALKLPCEAKHLGDISTSGEEGISGRVYLVNRETFAVLSFNYKDINENDAVFWAGTGSPSVGGDHLPYGHNIFASLETMVDQDLLVHIPAAVQGQAFTYLSVWSRSRNRNLGHIAFPSDSVPPLPDPVAAVRIGSFLRRLHQVSGVGYAINDTHLYLEDFNYDGIGPTVSFRAMRGSHYLLATEYADLADEKGNYGNLRGYNKEDIIVALPEGYTVHDTDLLSIWCERFRTSFGEIYFPDTVSFNPSNLQLLQPQPPTPEEECPPLEISQPKNCKRLHDSLTMSWTLDEQQNQATIELCGCDLDDQYVAFGLSGSNSGIQMFNSDPVWAWVDNMGVHAQELAINAYSQCNMRAGADGTVTQTGACPEASSNVNAVSGYVDGCTTCLKFNRPITASDSLDKSITPGSSQWVVWAVGPVGTLVTPSGAVIPVPFKHYLRPEYTSNLTIDFGRAPLDECGVTTCSCEPENLTPWPQVTLEHNTTLSVRIGQSGGKRGYAGITGIVGWGISIYLNGVLIPKVTVRRGTTYTFVTETGNDPDNLARYHPFYITSSQRGGYLTLSPEDQQAETVYAGRDAHGNWQGVGRFCYYGPEGKDTSDELSSFSQYKETLRLQCDDGTPGLFTWTPDDNTPDEVYYQCASHQYLGWKMNVVDPPPPPPEPIEIELAPTSPMVLGDTVIAMFTTSRLPLSVSCQIRNEKTHQSIFASCRRSFGNTYQFNATEVPTGQHTVVITVYDGENDNLRVDFERVVYVFDNPLSCAVYLIEEGVIFDKTRSSLSVKFAASGSYDSISCKLNSKKSSSCESPFALSNVRYNIGWNKVCITVNSCDGDETENLTVWFNTITGATLNFPNSKFC